jgi:hypothetical protein
MLRNVAPDFLHLRVVEACTCLLQEPSLIHPTFKILKNACHDLFYVAFWICYFSKKVGQIILIAQIEIHSLNLVSHKGISCINLVLYTEYLLFWVFTWPFDETRL